MDAVAASEVLGIEGGITYCSLVYQQLSCHTSIELDSDFNTLALGVSRSRVLVVLYNSCRPLKMDQKRAALQKREERYISLIGAILAIDHIDGLCNSETAAIQHGE